jgi:hypothetical protein
MKKIITMVAVVSLLALTIVVFFACANGNGAPDLVGTWVIEEAGVERSILTITETTFQVLSYDWGGSDWVFAQGARGSATITEASSSGTATYTTTEISDDGINWYGEGTALWDLYIGEENLTQTANWSIEGDILTFDGDLYTRQE